MCFHKCSQGDRPFVVNESRGNVTCQKSCDDFPPRIERCVTLPRVSWKQWYERATLLLPHVSQTRMCGTFSPTNCPAGARNITAAAPDPAHRLLSSVMDCEISGREGKY